ncbi:unnamed protein product [Pedinophyceae sp. YPF-701]|nr:unnamed protein product [Pedinophyceae sp. YPF-701]
MTSPPHRLRRPHIPHAAHEARPGCRSRSLRVHCSSSFRRSRGGRMATVIREVPQGAPGSGGSGDTVGDAARFGVITVSDRASQAVYKDESGPAILQFFKEAIASPWEAHYRLIPDEQPMIEKAIKELVDDVGCCLVVTTGGTGPSVRDVTPEATEAVCDRMMPGYGEQMRAISLRYVPTAVLSRQTAGLRGRSLVMNLPGKPKSIRETIDEVFVSIPTCIQIMDGPYIVTHESVVKAFRPASIVRKEKPAA